MKPEQPSVELPPRRGPTVPGKMVAIGLVAAAIVTIVTVVVVVYRTRDTDPLMREPAVGAGAGRTGMSNSPLQGAPPKPEPIAPH
jgi:hypothetical protein